MTSATTRRYRRLLFRMRFWIFGLRSPAGVSCVGAPEVVIGLTVPVPIDSGVMPFAVIAADLAVSVTTRERSVGLRALNELRHRWLASCAK